MNQLFLGLWAATIPLIPWALWRKNNEALSALVIVFFLLLINVSIMMAVPNPDNIRLIQVVAP